MIFDQRDDIIKFWNMCDRHMLLEGRGRDSDKVLVREIINYMDNEGFSTLILTNDVWVSILDGLNNSLKLRFASYDYLDIEKIKIPITPDLLVIEDVNGISSKFILKNIKWKYLLILSHYEDKIPSFFSGEIIHLE